MQRLIAVGMKIRHQHFGDLRAHVAATLQYRAGLYTPQQAMDGLAAAQDAVMARLEKSGVQGKCGPKLNAKTSMEHWVEEAKKNGTIAPQAKLDNEKPKGETIDYDALIKSWPASPPKK